MHLNSCKCLTAIHLINQKTVFNSMNIFHLLISLKITSKNISFSSCETQNLDKMLFVSWSCQHKVQTESDVEKQRIVLSILV